MVFNSRKAAEDYKAAIDKAANQLLDELYNDIKSGMDTSEGAKDLQKMSEDEENLFRRMVVGCADAVMDSYGTGTEMDKTNPFLAQYRNSALWNYFRKGTVAIVGRPKGYYTNIYGERMYSTGNRQGEDIEDYYDPQVPSYAFQRAETWLTKGNRVSEVLAQCINEWLSGIGQYFENG